MIDEVFSDALPLGDTLVRAAARYPDRPTLVFPGQSFTFAALLAAATRVARALHASGVRPGQHVGLLMPNSPELVEGLFGASLLGCVVVPLNTRFRSSELSYVIDHADLVAVLTTNTAEEHVDFSEVLRQSLPGLSSDSDPRNLALSASPMLRTIALLRGPSKPGKLGSEEFDVAADATPVDVIDRVRRAVRIRDAVLILYTSGTTARPKGCLLSHEAVTRGCIGRMRENLPLQEHNVFWSAGPLFHISSLQVLLGSVGLFGTYATDGYFQPDRAARLIRDLRVTSAWPWFPAVMQDLLASDEFHPEELTSLTSLMCIGPESLLRRVQTLFPNATHMNSSGMTEAGGIYAWSELTDDDDQRATAGGRPVSGFEVRILDPARRRKTDRTRWARSS